MRKSFWHHYDANNEPELVYPVRISIPDKLVLETLQAPNALVDLVMPNGNLTKLKSPLEMAMNSIAV